MFRRIQMNSGIRRTPPACAVDGLATGKPCSRGDGGVRYFRGFITEVQAGRRKNREITPGLATIS